MRSQKVQMRSQIRQFAPRQKHTKKQTKHPGVPIALTITHKKKQGKQHHGTRRATLACTTATRGCQPAGRRFWSGRQQSSRDREHKGRSRFARAAHDGSHRTRKCRGTLGRQASHRHGHVPPTRLPMRRRTCDAAAVLELFV